MASLETNSSSADVTLLSQFMSEIDENDIAANFENLATKNKRKMTFTLGGKNATHDAKAVTLRFRPQFLKELHASAHKMVPGEVRQRANSDISAAFKNGQIVLEVVNKDNTRTAYASEATAKELHEEKLVLKNREGKKAKYSEIKVINKHDFESISQSMLRNAVTLIASETVTTESITENTEHKASQSTHIGLQQITVQKSNTEKVTVTAPPAKKPAKPKDVEEQELLKSEEKNIEADRDRLHEKHTEEQKITREQDKIEDMEQREEQAKEQVIQTDSEVVDTKKEIESSGFDPSGETVQ